MGNCQIRFELVHLNTLEKRQDLANATLYVLADTKCGILRLVLKAGFSYYELTGKQGVS